MNSFILNKENFQTISNAIKYNDLKFFQFYNIDFSVDEFAFQDYMLKFNETADATVKILNKTYYDIEIYYNPEEFPDPEKAKYMVNSIALYNNITNKAIIFCVPFYTDMDTGKKEKCNIVDQNILNQEVNKIYKDLVDTNVTYKIDDLNIEVKVFNQEKDMLINFFKELNSLNSLFLIGFNSSLFDDPYIINRLKNLVGDSYKKYISLFGEVEQFGDRTFEWPDIINTDLLVMYKPVDSGGQGLGKSLPSYKLDTVADVELGIKKLDLDDLNQNYKYNLANFLTYNLLDTLLTFKLDQKLQFLELQWMLCKYNMAPMSSSRGRSLMYRYRNNLIYSKKNKLIRYRIFNREIFFPIHE
jgi:DNA polymerase elongation subunit (family B)